MRLFSHLALEQNSIVIKAENMTVRSIFGNTHRGITISFVSASNRICPLVSVTLSFTV